MYYVKLDGSYYQGDQESALDQSVPQRPNPDSFWDGKQWVPDPVKQRATFVTQINAARDAAIFSGVSYNGHVYDSDARSVMNLTATIAAVDGGMALPAPFYWRSRDNVNVAMTVSDLKGLATAMLINAYTVYAKSWAEKDAL